MAIEVFNRYENKYLLDEDTFSRLSRRLTDYMEVDPYNRDAPTYPIASLYYDTADHYLVRTSLGRPGYKEKLRVRAYGVPEADGEVYVEIKKKVKGLTNKRRSAMPLPEAYAFLKRGTVAALTPAMNGQVLREIRAMLARYPLQPSLYIAYDRRAYFGIGAHDLRVSFDRDIRFRQTDLCLEAGDFGSPLIRPDQWLMEVKAAQSVPVWLSRLLSDCRVFPISFSKVGRAYYRTLEGCTASPARRTAPAPLPAQRAGVLVIA